VLVEDHGASLEVPITNSFLVAISCNNFDVDTALAVDAAGAAEAAGVAELVESVALLLPQAVVIEINVTNAIINNDLRIFLSSLISF
jgi:hypothetical protein